MEMQFQKEAISYMKTLLHQGQKLEQTQQVRISDAMPDIGRILCCWGQIMIRGKEWRGDSVGVSGGVMAWVLYASEESGEPCCLDTWIPFQMKWDVEESERDGVIEIHTMLCHIDARMLSDRKLMVRANIGAKVHAMVEAESVLYKPTELPEAVEMLQRTYPMQLPVEAGEKSFEIKQSLEIPQDGARIHKLIRYCAHPELTEYKIVADKLVLRGTVDVYVLYMDETAKLHRQKWQLPFSQYTQLEGEYPPETEVSVCFALTLLEMEITQPDAVEFKTDFTAQYTISSLKNIAVTEDMYSPCCELDLSYGQLNIPATLHTKDREIHVEGTAPEGNILDVSLTMEMPSTERNGDAADTELEGMLQFLYADADGSLQSATQRWQKSVSSTISQDADYQITVCPMGVFDPDMATTMELHWNERSVAMSPLQQITGAETGEAIAADPQRPSLILRRVGNESLWEIAKSTGSTMDAIRRANGLQQEPDGNQLLLIPIS